MDLEDVFLMSRKKFSDYCNFIIILNKATNMENNVANLAELKIFRKTNQIRSYNKLLHENHVG